MIVAAQAAQQSTQSPRSWADVGMASLIIVLTVVLKWGGLDIGTALFSATCTIVPASWAMSLPHHLAKMSRLGRLVSRLAEHQHEILDNRSHGSGQDVQGEDFPRIGPVPPR